MSPFTRQDARDLVVAFALSGAWYGLGRALVPGSTYLSTAVSLAAMLFLLQAPNRVDPAAARRLGDRRERRRVWRELTKGRVPEKIDRQAWSDYLAMIPNEELRRRRTRWVLTLCGVAAFACLAAASASFALHTTAPLRIAGHVGVTVVGTLIAVGIIKLVPRDAGGRVAALRSLLQESP